MSSSRHSFKLGERPLVRFRNKTVVGKIIGIDDYHMENFKGGKLYWPSYTLIADHAKPFDRYWFADWGKDGWILWLTAQKLPANTRPLLERGGIARLDFSGDQGASTPCAALSMHKKGAVIYCVERFSGSKVMLFSGHKIKPPLLS